MTSGISKRSFRAMHPEHEGRGGHFGGSNGKGRFRRRYRRLRMSLARHALAIVVLNVVCFGAAIPLAYSQSLKETACQLFHGKRACGSAVEVIDPKACIIAVRSKAYEKLDPADAGCLIETVGARRVFLRNAGRAIKAVPVPAGDGKPAQVSIHLTGRGVAHLMTAHDKHGAPVWTPHNRWEFKPGGDKAATLGAIARLTRNLCPLQSTAARPVSKSRTMTARAAFEQAARGDIVLIDIRRRSEWRQTGIGKHAVPITMDQDFSTFIKQVRTLAAQRGNRPIALICANGGRSHQLQKRLAQQGFSNVIDVHDGMVGGFHGPGWINSDLPVRPFPARPAPRK